MQSANHHNQQVTPQERQNAITKLTQFLNNVLEGPPEKAQELAKKFELHVFTSTASKEAYLSTIIARISQIQSRKSNSQSTANQHLEELRMIVGRLEDCLREISLVLGIDSVVDDLEVRGRLKEIAWMTEKQKRALSSEEFIFDSQRSQLMLMEVQEILTKCKAASSSKDNILNDTRKRKNSNSINKQQNNNGSVKELTVAEKRFLHTIEKLKSNHQSLDFHPIPQQVEIPCEEKIRFTRAYIEQELQFLSQLHEFLQFEIIYCNLHKGTIEIVIFDGNTKFLLETDCLYPVSTFTKVRMLEDKGGDYTESVARLDRYRLFKPITLTCICTMLSDIIHPVLKS